MARRCELTGKGVQSGHRVSHANNRTNRVFRPNLHVVTLASDILGRSIRLRVCMNALRTLDRTGGLDAFLMKARDSGLSEKALRLKREVAKRSAAKGAKSAA